MFACRYSRDFFFRAPLLVSSKPYNRMPCNDVVPTAFLFLEGLKNLSHFGLCGACSWTIQCTVISEFKDRLGGIATTFPTWGRHSLLVNDIVAMSIPTRSCFTMSWFWTTELLVVPMYIYRKRKAISYS